MSNPTRSSDWLPIIDISKWQGNINFSTMKNQGIPGVIMRATHGKSHDSKVVEYYDDARAAGYDKQDIGFYSFINPKRGSGKDTARATFDFIKTFREDTERILYMLDIENYKNEGPNSGSSPLSGYAFSVYLREHMAEFQRLAPDAYIMAYSNRAYWNSSLGPNDANLASELDWIVPRYPVYSKSGYDRYPVPGPSQWDEWAWDRKSAGPQNPIGSTWQGWQFSAGYNGEGPRYGCQSPDLDLNIVERSAWERWIQKDSPDVPDVIPPILPPIFGDEMKNLVPHEGVRVYDSRKSGKKVNTKGVFVPVAQKTPDGADVLVNLTVLEPDEPGYISVWGGTGDSPEISQVNYSPDDASPQNGFTVTNTNNGKFKVFSSTGAHVLVDQVAYVEDVDTEVDIDIDIDMIVEAAVDTVVERLKNG